MALDARYITGVDLEQYFVDKVTGEPLANGYVKFWEDESRTTPKNVYQLSGSPPNYVYEVLPNPLTLSSVGTPENANGDNVAIYYYPYDENGDLEYYYVEVFNENDVLQLTREGWPNITERDDPSFDASTTDNQISNSQFVDVSFFPDEGVTIVFDTAISSVSYDIAPDWSVVISSNGAGSLTVNRIALEGALNIDTNPPYIMTFLPSGATISSLRLVQRLSHNPGIWSSTVSNTGYVAGYMLVSSLDGSNHTVQMQYSPSVAPSAQTIVSGATGISGYKALYATVELDASVNSDDANDGYVNIEIVLPVNGYVSVTSVQLKGLYANETISLYDQETVNRQVDHLFHYYKQPLEFKPIPSFLVGWDFPLNPRQFGSSGTLSATSQYIFDQTIGFQTTSSSFSFSSSSTYGLQIASLIASKFALIQYIQVNDEMFNSPLSVNVNMGANVSGGCFSTVSVWYTNSVSLPDITTGISIVQELSSNGYPTALNGDWQEIQTGNISDSTFSVTNTSEYETIDYGVSGFHLEDPSDAFDNAQWVAVVVGFSTIPVASTLNFQSVSLVPGTIPTRPASQTRDDVLRECQFYYQKSYSPSTLPGTPTLFNAIYCRQNLISPTAINTDLYATFFQIELNSSMIVEQPEINLYGVLSGTSSGQVTVQITNNLSYATPSSGTNPKNITVIGNWGGYSQGDSRASYYGNNLSIMEIAGVHENYDGMILLHYTADARPGTF